MKQQKRIFGNKFFKIVIGVTLAAILIACQGQKQQVMVPQAIVPNGPSSSSLVIGWQEAIGSAPISGELETWAKTSSKSEEQFETKMIAFIDKNGKIRIVGLDGREVSPCGDLHTYDFQTIVNENMCQGLRNTNIQYLDSEVTFIHTGSNCVTRKIGGYLVQICN